MIWRTLLISLAPLAFFVEGFSQHPSAMGNFEVSDIRGCAPLTVTVTLDPGFVCDNLHPCAAFYENDSVSTPIITPPFTHTYTQPGVYWLKVLRHPITDSVRIEVAPNIAPQFDVYTCGNNEVAVQLNDSHYDQYILNYNDGSPEVTLGGSASDHHVYSPGTHTVTVRGRDLGGADNCAQASRTVTPLVTLPAPTITLLEVLDNTSIRLSFDALPNVQYKLGIATNSNANFQQVGTVYNTNVDTVFNLRTNENYYCFQLAAFDPCNNTVINSAVICSADLDVSARNKAMDIRWSTATAGITGYALRRTAGDGTTLVMNPAGSPVTDTGIQCGIEYCYRLTSVYANGSQSISETQCATGISNETPPAIDNVSAVVGDGGVVLNWQSDPAFVPAEFTIERSAGGNYNPLGTTSQHTYTDGEYNGEETFCYRIRYRDECDNESPPGIEACPIRLTGSLHADNSIALTWTPYAGWSDGVDTYVLEKYSEDGTLLQSISVGTATDFVDDNDDPNHQMYVYVVRAAAKDTGLPPSVSNPFTALKNPNIFYPTAFTPNGDHLNDIFSVFGQYVVAFEMQIFNRWGELLFTTNDISSGWDGTYNGREMPEGTYTFVAHITDRVGRTFKHSGSVLLLRRR